MRKILLLIFIAVLWYTAGYFRVANLMALAVTAALLFPLMWVLCLYLKRNLRLTVRPESEARVQGRQGVFLITVENRGRLPVSLFRAGVRADYVRALSLRKKKGKALQTFTGFVCAKERRTEEVSVNLPQCGLICVSLQKVRVWDYLRLFTGRIRKAQSCTAAVFPGTGPAWIYFAPRKGTQTGQTGQNRPFSEYSGDGEFRQLREYREGDHFRRIHWKKSAGGEQLWVREYEAEAASLRFYLDLRGKAAADADHLSAFYELLYSLLLGLTAQGCRAEVVWRAAGTEPDSISVSCEEDIRELLWRLYRQEPEFYPGGGQGAARPDQVPDRDQKPPAVQGAEPERGPQPEEEPEPELRLDLGLCLYWQGRRLYAFTPGEVREGGLIIDLQGEER